MFLSYSFVFFFFIIILRNIYRLFCKNLDLTMRSDLNLFKMEPYIISAEKIQSKEDDYYYKKIYER